MALKERTLFGSVDKVEDSLALIWDHRPEAKNDPEPRYWVGCSGGKDSSVVEDLVMKTEVKAEFHYNQTTIDPPLLIYHLRKYYPHVVWDRPKRPFLKALITSGAPGVRFPWCCSQYKEKGGGGRTCLLGIRRDESENRKDRKFVELCYQDSSKQIINPILTWTDAEVWEYIRKNNIPYCSLYDEGFKRLGCLFCPKKSVEERLKDVERYPRYAKLFIKYFQYRVDYCDERGLTQAGKWKDGEQFFNKWIRSYG